LEQTRDAFLASVERLRGPDGAFRPPRELDLADAEAAKTMKIP
jgi:hypothetical protein